MPAPATLPCSVVCYYPVQLRPVVVMQEASIDSLQQQVRTFWGEFFEFRIFLWGGGIPPHVSDLNWGPVGSFRLLLLYLLPPWATAPSPLLCFQPDGSPFWPVAPLSACCWLCGGGGGGVALSFPSPPSPPVHLPSSTPLASTAPTPSPSDLLGLLSLGCRSLATMWAAPWR